MDLFLTILNKSNLSRSYIPIPTVDLWLSHISAVYIVCLALGIFFTVVTMLLTGVHMYFVYNYIGEEVVRNDMYYLVFMCPIVALCGAVGMAIPRAATFLYAVALVYFMICIFITITLMNSLHGGRPQLVKKLLARNRKVNMRILPLGCCLFCLPKLTPTDEVFRRIEWLVFQSPLFRICLEILNLVVYMELNSRLHIFFQLTNLLGIGSLLVASWGSYMIVPLGSKLLKNYRFSFMFHLVDTSQLIYSVQKVIFDFLAGIDVIDSEQFLSSSAKAQYWMCFLLTLEMFVVSLISTVAFRPSKTALFDKYKPPSAVRFANQSVPPTHRGNAYRAGSEHPDDEDIEEGTGSGGNESGIGSVSSSSSESINGLGKHAVNGVAEPTTRVNGNRITPILEPLTVPTSGTTNNVVNNNNCEKTAEKRKIDENESVMVVKTQECNFST